MERVVGQVGEGPVEDLLGIRQVGPVAGHVVGVEPGDLGFESGLVADVIELAAVVERDPVERVARDDRHVVGDGPARQRGQLVEDGDGTGMIVGPASKVKPLSL